MKLRKKQIKVPKNFFVAPWRILIFYRGIFDFLGGRTYNRRDARECLAGGRPLSNHPTSNGCRDARSSVRCIKGYSVMALTGTDARPSVPTTVTRPALTGADALRLDTIRASLHGATRLAVLQRTPSCQTLPCVPTPVIRLERPYRGSLVGFAESRG